ncbi:conserved protein of unknown function [Limnospira indica PCC 8005]|uniref:Uncharacterized protein n=1 Tax=Limnospira indica PCC 8005 TaxID=376219 RepID=A0A9P1KIN0_9CYAN|nr:conserved protein of unknown function [Limnospira indica PCC 8005]
MVEYNKLASEHPYNCLYVPKFSIIRYKMRQGTQGQQTL